MKAYLSLLAAAGLLTACGSDAQLASAPPGAGSGRTCFMPSDVTGWSEGRGNNFHFRTQRGDYFQATMIPTCMDADFSQSIAIVPRTGYMICAGDDAALVVPRTAAGGPESCRLDNLRKMAPEEVAALPAADRP